MPSLLGLIAMPLATVLAWPAWAEVVIGAAGPMTGKLSWIGEQLQRGTEMAVSDLNAASGVLGEQLLLVVADDFCDPAQAVAAGQKLVADGAVLVVGHTCSDASIPASEVYESGGVIQISPASTNPTLTDAGRANVFRLIGRDDTQGVVAGDFLADEWADKNIAILHDGTTYGKGLADVTKAHLNKRGVSEARYEPYVPGKEDYSAEIAALDTAGISVIYVGGYHPEVALMARAAHDRGYAVQLVSGDAMATEEFGLVAGQAGEGTRFTFVADPRQNPAAAAVIEQFRAEAFEPDGFTLPSYAAVQVWAQAAEKAGSLEPSKVIPSLHGQQFDTVLGAIDFDEKGDLTEQSWIWYIWRGLEYVPLE